MPTPRGRKKKSQNGSVQRQPSFEDVDLGTLPGITEETITGLCTELETYFETKDAASRNAKAARAIKKTIPDVGTATRFRIADKGIVEARPRNREPYSVKAGMIVGKAIKRPTDV